ncbi:MAG: hypothetical protein ACRDWD_09345 [Acidimicrobiia bacterium]
MAERNDNIESALDFCVYGPIGMALYARDTVPGFMKAFAARGRAEMSRRKSKVSDQANSVGQLAISYGVPEVRRRAAGIWTMVEQVVVTRWMPPTPTSPPTPREKTAGARRTADARSDVTPGPRPQLAIPDYDELSASQVVDRLDGLGNEELAQVRDYEASNRGRRTILGKIDQLAHR